MLDSVEIEKQIAMTKTTIVLEMMELLQETIHSDEYFLINQHKCRTMLTVKEYRIGYLNQVFLVFIFASLDEVVTVCARPVYLPDK